MRIASSRSHASRSAQRASRALEVRERVPASGEVQQPEGSGGVAAPAVVVTLSPAAQRAAEDPRLFGARSDVEADEAQSASAAAAAEGSRLDGEAGPGGLTKEDEQVVRELAQRDRQVRSHEAAHQAAGGEMAGAASYTTEAGPDGRQYAVGGEVPIDMSPGRTPEETIQRAERVRAAALAPADPSPQDRAVAASAAQMEAQAQAQLAEQRRAEASTSGASSARPASSSEGAASSSDAREKAVAQRALAAYLRAAA